MAYQLFIEGPEGAGKTTLATAVARAWFPRPSITHKLTGGLSSDPGLVNSLLKVTEAFDNEWLFIWDRCWLSDAVYAELLNRKPLWTPALIAYEESRPYSHRLLLTASHYDENARTKVGCLVAEEAEAYQRLASMHWTRVHSEVTAQQVIRWMTMPLQQLMEDSRQRRIDDGIRPA